MQRTSNEPFSRWSKVRREISCLEIEHEQALARIAELEQRLASEPTGLLAEAIAIIEEARDYPDDIAGPIDERIEAFKRRATVPPDVLRDAERYRYIRSDACGLTLTEDLLFGDRLDMAVDTEMSRAVLTKSDAAEQVQRLPGESEHHARERLAWEKDGPLTACTHPAHGLGMPKELCPRCSTLKAPTETGR